MLPLEKLTKEARLGFEKQGIDTEALDIALELDRDLDGIFGETWLAFDSEKKKLYALSVTSDSETEQKRKKARRDAEATQAKAKKNMPEEFFIPGLFDDAVFKEFDMTRIFDAYIDNFVSSNRLLTKDHPYSIDLQKDGERPDFAEEKRRQKERDADATTIIIAYAQMHANASCSLLSTS